MIKLLLGKKNENEKPLFCDIFFGYSNNIEMAADFNKSWTNSISDFDVFLYDNIKNELLELTRLSNQDLLDKKELDSNFQLSLIRLIPKNTHVFGRGIYLFKKLTNETGKVIGYQLTKYYEDIEAGVVLYENENAVKSDIISLLKHFEFFKITNTFNIPEKKKEISLEDATKILFASSNANVPLEKLPSLYPFAENVTWNNVAEDDVYLLSNNDKTEFWKLHRILPQELGKRIINDSNCIIMLLKDIGVGIAGIRTIRLSYSYINGDWVWIHNNNLNSTNNQKLFRRPMNEWIKDCVNIYSKPNPLISFYYAEKITKEEAESYCKKKEQKYYYYNYICKPMDINWAIKSAKPIDNMLDFLFNNMKEEFGNIKPCFLASTYNEYEETEAIERFGSFESKYCFNYKDDDFYVKQEKYYYTVCSLKHPQVTFESEQYFPNYYAGLNNKDFTNPVYDELVEILVNKNLVSKDCMTDFRGLLSVVKEIPKNAYEKQASNKYYYAIDFYNDSITTKYLQTNEDYSSLPFEVAYINLVKYLIRDGILEKEHKNAVVKNITQSPLFKSSYEKQMAILEKTKTDKNFDAAFVILPHNNGLNKIEINELLDIVNSEEVYTLDIEGDFSDAIGFISAKSFDEKLDYNAKELSEYIEAILNDAELENSNETYHWRKKDMLFKMSHRKE